jgi:hypothetical protein
MTQDDYLVGTDIDERLLKAARVFLDERGDLERGARG